MSRRSSRSSRARYIREHFFGTDPRLLALVADKCDDEIKALRRGGHDYRKLYAAYRAAVEHRAGPTVILAQTVKGWTLGPGVEARNITHQAKKLSEQELRDLPRPPRAAHPGRQAQGGALLPPRVPTSPEIQYLMERAPALGGPLPRRVVDPQGARAPGRRRLRRVHDRLGHPGSLDHDGLRQAAAEPPARPGRSASASCPSSRTRRAPSAWTRSSRRSASTRRWGSATTRSTPTWCSPTARRPTARCSRRASRRPAHRPRSRPPAPPTPRTASR